MPLTVSAARPLPASQDDVRRHDLGSLLSLLHVRGATSRADLTALTGLNRSTVRALTSELVDAGLAVESALVGRGSVGRRPARSSRPPTGCTCCRSTWGSRT